MITTRSTKSSFLKQLFLENSSLLELNLLEEKRGIVQLLRKLAPLEEEIIQHPEGRININEVGSILSIDGLPEELVVKIRESLSNQYVVVNKSVPRSRLINYGAFQKKC